jgi:RimJ/RimL family protein N-acetyltransferase
MHIFLETERMVLRRFTMDDIDLLVELDNDVDVMAYISPGVEVTRDEIVNETLPAFMSYYARFAGYGFWAAVDKATGRFLGWFHFRPHDGADSLEPELGYRLHRFAWGNGFGTEGSRALVDYGFEMLGVERVVAETMVVHTASRRIMEKVGLRLVRTFHADWPVRIPGDEQGDVEYAITRDEWTTDRLATP